MGEFFRFIIGFSHGWRRGLGLRALVLASIFMIGWIRSLAYYDEIRFHTSSDWTYGVVSTDSTIGWESRNGFEAHRGQSLSFAEFFIGNPFVDISGSTDPRISRWDWKWYWCGFGYGTAVYGYGNDSRFETHAIWIAPYWSIVGPLTLLSACLLLSKPRKSTGKKISEPTPAVGT